MAGLDELEALQKIDLLCVGESGSGKTGGLASLVDVGFHMNILDFDKGTRVLKNYVKRPELLSNVDVQQISDKYRKTQAGPVRGASAVMAYGLKEAKAFMAAMTLLEDWPGFGPIESWPADHILVIDSLTFMAKAAINYIMLMNGRMNVNPEQSDYFAAQETVERVIARLTSDVVKCHLIVNTHIDVRGQEGASQQRAYPMVLGKALSPKIGTFFNNLVAFRTTPTGKREINTRTEGTLACKLSAPGIPTTLPIETGLADLFGYLLGTKKLPTSAASASTAGPIPGQK